MLGFAGYRSLDLIDSSDRDRSGYEINYWKLTPMSSRPTYTLIAFLLDPFATNKLGTICWFSMAVQNNERLVSSWIESLTQSN